MRCSACFLIAALAAACDGPTDPDAAVARDASLPDGSADHDAGVGDGGSDAGTSDAGSSDAGTSDAGTSDAGSGLRQATMSLIQNRTGVPASHVVYGGFFPELVAPPIAEEGVVPCGPSAMAGSCGFYRCGLGARATAGTLTVEVEGTEIARITTPASSGDYGGAGEGIVAELGDDVTFRATGDEVPAFSGTVVAPGAIAATLPATVPRDEPLTVAWTASGAERMQVVIGAGPDAIVCIVDAADGSVEIAPELLGMHPAGPGAVALTAFNFVGVTAGDYRVLLTAGDGTFRMTTLE